MINQAAMGLGKEPSSIRELFAYGLERKAQIGEDKVFDFSLGNPSVPAPKAVACAIHQIADLEPSSVHGYTPAQGAPAVRSTIADSLNRRFGTQYTAGNLYLTCGAAASLNICLRALVNPGDEVVVVAPFFPEYRVWIEGNGATLVMVPARESDFQIDADALASALNERTKAVIINSPNNPVGVVYSRKTLEATADVLRQASKRVGHPIYLMSDEPYRELVYSGREVPWVPSIYEDTIVCYSWSKSLSMPGERIGFLLVPDSVTDASDVYAAVCGAGRVLGFVCAPALFQQVIARCVDEPADIAAYERNRVMLTDIMDEAGLSYIEPQGAFYLWVKSPEPDAKAFAERAKRYELLLVPSDSFGVTGWVRLGYCVSERVIAGSRDAFLALAAEYR
ncbi:MAG: pyridoxal phosphate-dependent aminotransferase [Eggerthellaceae bacterium]|nr:pyridoxal phosphate-dependent aminotransferase [Eggerthellaceae bacterium]